MEMKAYFGDKIINVNTMYIKNSFIVHWIIIIIAVILVSKENLSNSMYFTYTNLCIYQLLTNVVNKSYHLSVDPPSIHPFWIIYQFSLISIVFAKFVIYHIFFKCHYICLLSVEIASVSMYFRHVFSWLLIFCSAACGLFVLKIKLELL